jgi:hypothetical protein
MRALLLLTITIVGACATVSPTAPLTQRVIFGKIVGCHGEPRVGLTVRRQMSVEVAVTDASGNFEMSIDVNTSATEASRQLWIPGTNHAEIAPQFETTMMERGLYVGRIVLCAIDADTTASKPGQTPLPRASDSRTTAAPTSTTKLPSTVPSRQSLLERAKALSMPSTLTESIKNGELSESGADTFLTLTEDWVRTMKRLPARPATCQQLSQWLCAAHATVARYKSIEPDAARCLQLIGYKYSRAADKKCERGFQTAITSVADSGETYNRLGVALYPTDEIPKKSSRITRKMAMRSLMFVAILADFFETAPGRSRWE